MMRQVNRVREGEMVRECCVCGIAVTHGDLVVRGLGGMQGRPVRLYLHAVPCGRTFVERLLHGKRERA
jgi:hypothetical protein